MSEIKCHVCGFIGSSADCLGWEHTCTDIMKDKNKALERQLTEAREALSSIRGILPTVYSSDREIHEIINKVLKEQG